MYKTLVNNLLTINKEFISLIENIQCYYCGTTRRRLCQSLTGPTYFLSSLSQVPGLSLQWGRTFLPGPPLAPWLSPETLLPVPPGAWTYLWWVEFLCYSCDLPKDVLKITQTACEAPNTTFTVKYTLELSNYNRASFWTRTFDGEGNA